MLSEPQIRQYTTFGFAVMRKVLRPGEIPLCAAELERALDAAYAHKPFDGTRKQVVTAMGPETPFMASLLEDPRILGPAQQLGGDVLGLISDVNRRVGDTPWHPDADAGFPCGVKFAWMLEPVGAASGALRLVPGSHLNPLHDDLRSLLLPFPPPGEPPKVPVAGVPAHACEAGAGDVVVFDPRAWHSSVGEPTAAGCARCSTSPTRRRPPRRPGRRNMPKGWRSSPETTTAPASRGTAPSGSPTGTAAPCAGVG